MEENPPFLPIVSTHRILFHFLILFHDFEGRKMKQNAVGTVLYAYMPIYYIIYIICLYMPIYPYMPTIFICQLYSHHAPPMLRWFGSKLFKTFVFEKSRSKSGWKKPLIWVGSRLRQIGTFRPSRKYCTRLRHRGFFLRGDKTPFIGDLCWFT